MGLRADNPFIDGGLDAIALCDEMYVTTAEPANYAAISGVSLGTVALSGGDFTIADGDTSGRKVTVGAKTISSASGSGTGNHIVLTDGTNLITRPFTGQVITSGNPINVGAFDWEIADPADE